MRTAGKVQSSVLEPCPFVFSCRFRDETVFLSNWFVSPAFFPSEEGWWSFFRPGMIRIANSDPRVGALC